MLTSRIRARVRDDLAASQAANSAASKKQNLTFDQNNGAATLKTAVCAQEADAGTLGAVAELPCVDESIGYGKLIRAQSSTCLFGLFGSYITDNGAMPDPRRMLNDTLFGGTEIASIPMTAIPEGQILESELEDYNLELHRKAEKVERRLLEFFPTF